MSITRWLLVLAALTTTTACSGDGGGGGKKDNGPLNELDAVYSSAISVDLTWVNEAEGATNVLVQRALDDSGPFEDIATIAPAATEYRDQSGLDLTTQYFYRVVVVGGADEGGSSRVVTPGDPPSIPPAPDSADTLTATVLGPGSIDVNWTHSGENVVGFRLERQMFFAGFNFVQIAELPADARSFSDTCLRPESPFHYRLTAYNGAGETAVRTTTSVATTPVETAAPTIAPSNLQAIPVNSDSYRIQWENGCTQAQLILVEFAVNDGGFSNILGTSFFSSDAEHFFFIDLPQGNSYDFRVSAFNDLGTTAATPLNDVLGPTVAEPPTGGWVGINADYDNTRVYSDLLPTSTATAFPNGNLVAGCFWSFNSFLGMQNFNCYSSALHFPMSGTSTGSAPFNLSGKVIDQAYLVLSVSSVPINPTNLNVSAIATPWSTNTLNGNMSLNLYGAGASVNLSPGIYGGYAIDVTTIVQNWANGTAQNHGILIEDAEYVFPYNSLIRTSFFWSTDSFNNSADNKPTLWVDYH